MTRLIDFSPMMISPEQPSEESLTPEERWSLVERVAASSTLQRSARLRTLLLHVGHHSIVDNGTPLREMDIGTAVFGRPSTYDTNQDNIVRVNFSELRKRIQHYFSAEGQSEPIYFDIPRGSYELRFFKHPRDAFDLAHPDLLGSSPIDPASSASTGRITATEPSSLALQAKEDTTRSMPTPGGRTWILACQILAFLMICSTITAIWYAGEYRRAESEVFFWKSGPTLRRFWQPFLGGPDPVDIVLADSSLALAQDLTGRDLSLSDYISYNYQPLYEAEAARNSQSSTTKLLLSRNTGSAGDFKVAAMLQALGPRSLSRIVFARGYSTSVVRDHNSVLLGSRRSNPWVELLEDRLQYRFSSSPDRRETYLNVLHPGPGEEAQYVTISDPSARVSYAVIAVLPSPGGNAHTLLIAGTNSQATLAAGEILTSEGKLEEISRRVGSSSMDHMQILIRADAMRDTPINAKILSITTQF